MAMQDDIDRAVEEMDSVPADVLPIYAYACLKLLKQKRPNSFRDGESFDLFIADSPIYSPEFEREIQVNIDIRLQIKESVTGD